MLPVSFFIVSNVVAQGKWKQVNSITLIAVSNVQPLLISIWPIEAISSMLTNDVPFK